MAETSIADLTTLVKQAGIRTADFQGTCEDGSHPLVAVSPLVLANGPFYTLFIK